MSDLYKGEAIRALSWRQPFGTLMLHDKIETRTWKTGYRGLVLICISKLPYTKGQIKEICGHRQHLRIGNLFYEHSLSKKDHLGYAIGVGRLVDCRPMTPEDQDDCYVEIKYGLYCHIYEDVVEDIYRKAGRSVVIRESKKT